MRGDPLALEYFVQPKVRHFPFAPNPVLWPVLRNCGGRSGHKWLAPAQKKFCLLVAHASSQLLLLDLDSVKPVLDQLKEIVGHGQHV